MATATAGQSETTTAEPVWFGNLPNIDIARGAFTYSDGMDFDDVNGSFNLSRIGLLSLLSRPITIAGDLTLLPMFQYGLTSVEFDDVGAAFPLDEEDLHSMSLHLAAMKPISDSQWFLAGWGRAELATDFQHINGDDFTFDIAGGVGYRVSDTFMIAAGAAVMNLNGDTWVCPGINFNWVVSDQIRVGLYGPMPVISYSPNDDWNFSLRGIPGGGVWNITDDIGDSKSIDISSYQLGAYVGRKITGKLWLNAGVGMTVGNNIELSDPDGDNSTFDEDADSGLFGMIGLSLKAW